MIDNIGFIVITLLLFATFNGLIIKWNRLFQPTMPLKDELEEGRRQVSIELWSTWWHRCSLAIRVCLWTEIWILTENWFVTILIIICDCLWYPVLINLINKWKWYHVGTTAWFDKLIRKLFPKINFD